MYESHSVYSHGGTSFGEAAAFIAIIVVAIAVVMAISLAIQALVCYLLSKCLREVPAEHRQITPGKVWLLMIPLFNLIWVFFVFMPMSDSFKSYFNARGRYDVGDCGRQIGLWYCICVVASLVPLVNYLAGPAGLVLLIVYIVKAFELRNKVRQCETAAPASISLEP